ncbi:MAG: pesticin C-terminus-like muramidase [Ferruginibacter sp.]
MTALRLNASLTYSNEGNSDPKSPFYSKKAHWPKGRSGVTIGRGYDMGKKSKSKILKDLKAAGVDSKLAELLSDGANLFGENAKQFVETKEISAIELTTDQEIMLFNNTHQELDREFQRICQKSDVEKKYGDCNLSKVDPGIREYAVDLIYRGDYSPSSREKIQKAIVSNDYDTLIKQAEDKSNWGNIDGNRFNERIKHLKHKKLLFNLSKGKASNTPTSK